MIYTHVLNRGPLGVTSPADLLSDLWRDEQVDIGPAYRSGVMELHIKIPGLVQVCEITSLTEAVDRLTRARGVCRIPDPPIQRSEENQLSSLLSEVL